MPRKKSERCRVCGHIVRVQIFKNTGICSDNCRKIDNGETNAVESKYRRTPRVRNNSSTKVNTTSSSKIRSKRNSSKT